MAGFPLNLIPVYTIHRNFSTDTLFGNIMQANVLGQWGISIYVMWFEVIALYRILKTSYRILKSRIWQFLIMKPHDFRSFEYSIYTPAVAHEGIVGPRCYSTPKQNLFNPRKIHAVLWNQPLAEYTSILKKIYHNFYKHIYQNFKSGRVSTLHFTWSKELTPEVLNHQFEWQKEVSLTALLQMLMQHFSF
jgi:hypothetical protein